MKRVIAFIFSIILLLSVAACGRADVPNNLPDGNCSSTSSHCPADHGDLNNLWVVTEGITLRLIQDCYLPGTNTMTLVLENRSDSVMMYGQGWSFEKYDNGIWRELETIRNHRWTLEAYTLYNHDRQTFPISTWFLTEELTEGVYRVTGLGTLTVAPDDSNLSRGGNRIDYPPYQLEFSICAAASTEPDSLPREDWQWLSRWEIWSIYENKAIAMKINGGTVGVDGFVAVLYYDPAEHNLFDKNLLGKPIYMLDILDRKTGKRYKVLTEPIINYGDEESAVCQYQDGFKVDIGELLYVFINTGDLVEIVKLS